MANESIKEDVYKDSCLGPSWPRMSLAHLFIEPNIETLIRATGLKVGIRPSPHANIYTDLCTITCQAWSLNECQSGTRIIFSLSSILPLSSTLHTDIRFGVIN